MSANSPLVQATSLRFRVLHGRGPLIALLLLVLANVVLTKNFYASNNLWNILVQITPTTLVAVGMTFVIATGGIDLSVGSLMAIASAVAATNLGHGTGLAILLGMSVAAAIGTANGALIAGLRIQPIIITLAVLIAGRGMAQVISNGGELIPIDNASFEELGRGRVGGIPVQVIVATLVAVAAAVILRRTVLGRHILAVGGNEKAAALSGVNVWATKIIVYGMSGALAGLAGLIEGARLGASDAAKVGLNIELDAIAAVVVGGTLIEGGTATIFGTIVGALIMQVITTSLNMLLIPYEWSLVVKGAVMLVVMYSQRSRAE